VFLGASLHVDHVLAHWLWGVGGAAAVGVGSVLLARSLNEVWGQTKWPGHIFSRRQLARGPKIVALGGGTGLPVVLRGLKQYTANLTAVVTVADDGGSSGRLRGALGVLPPGDIRNCLVALADTEPLMADLFQHRFEEGELAGHSFGNLFLAAMEKTVGDFVTALKESSRVLAVRGTVLPATLEHVTLKAELADGTVIAGESHIGNSSQRILRVWMDPPDATPLAEAVAAIMRADMVVLGPGSLYTSVIPNLLVTPIAQAIRETPAVKVYVANVMTQPGETSRYSLTDHVEAIESYLGAGTVDVVLVNNQPVPAEMLERYAREGAEPVTVARGASPFGVQVVSEPLLEVGNVVRHDPDRLARALLRILVRHRPRWAEGRPLDALWLETRLKERQAWRWPGAILAKSRQS
jgi:uncharacterized cofD-like protein